MGETARLILIILCCGFLLSVSLVVLLVGVRGGKRKLREADGQIRGHRKVESFAKLCSGHLQAGHHLLHPAKRDDTLVSKMRFPLA